MQKTLTLNVPDYLFDALGVASRRDGMTRGQKALQLMRKQLAIDSFNVIADKMERRCRALGLRSDADIFASKG